MQSRKASAIRLLTYKSIQLHNEDEGDQTENRNKQELLTNQYSNWH